MALKLYIAELYLTLFAHKNLNFHLENGFSVAFNKARKKGIHS